MKRSPLRRYKRINPISAKRRTRSGKPGKLGIVRLFGASMTDLRRRVFNRDKFLCQWCEDDGQICGKIVAWEGPNAGHLAHIVGRGAGGSDTEENTRTLCAYHHLVSEHNPKSVPAKKCAA